MSVHGLDVATFGLDFSGGVLGSLTFSRSSVSTEISPVKSEEGDFCCCCCCLLSCFVVVVVVLYQGSGNLRIMRVDVF